MEDLYPKAYKEVIEILKYVPDNYFNKISEDFLNMLKNNMDNDYYFNPEEDKEWLMETKAILANIYRDYWATPEQKIIIKEKDKYERRLIEKEKRNKYDPNNIFKNKKINTDTKAEINQTQNLPAEIKKENFLKKIISIIKRFLNNKK